MLIQHIVKKLGTQHDVAKAAGVTQPAVAEWVRSNQIPSKRIQKLLIFAQKKGIDLSATDFFEGDR